MPTSSEPTRCVDADEARRVDGDRAHADLPRQAEANRHRALQRQLLLRDDRRVGVDADAVAADAALTRRSPAVLAAAMHASAEADELARCCGRSGTARGPLQTGTPALQRVLAQAVGVEGAVHDHGPQPELDAQLAQRLQHDLVDLRVHADRVLVAEQAAQVLEVRLELRLRALAGVEVLPRAVVALTALQRVAQALVHAHHRRAEVAGAALGVAGLGDLQAAGEAHERLLGRARGLRQRAEATHVRARTRDEEHGRHAAGQRARICS